MIEYLWGAAPIIAVQAFFGPDWLRVFEGLTLLGEAEAALVVAALVLWLRGRSLAYGLLAIVLVVASINPPLKALVDLPRPHDPRITIWHTATQASFPSGHSATAATLWGTLALLGRLPILVAVSIIGGVMLSRMYLGVHYLGDVVGGAIFGLSMAMAYRRLWPTILQVFSGRPFAFFLGLGVLVPAVTLAFAGITSTGWELFGVALGAGIAMPIERHFVQFAPRNVSRAGQALKVVIGLCGLVGILLFGELGLPATPAAGVVTFALAAMWTILGAPWLFTRIGLVRPAHRHSTSGED